MVSVEGGGRLKQQAKRQMFAKNLCLRHHGTLITEQKVCKCPFIFRACPSRFSFSDLGCI
jgi:hypothetical protein